MALGPKRLHCHIRMWETFRRIDPVEWMSFGSIQLYYFTLGQLLFVTGVDEIWPSLLYSIGISSQATFQDEAEAIKIFMFHAIHRFCWMFAQFGISKKQVSLQMVLPFVDKLKLLGFVLFLVVATQALFIVTPKIGEIRSNLTCAYFSSGLVQPPTR